MTDARIEFCSSIDQLEAREWNGLGGGAHPFASHEFFAALEHAACVGAGTGWQPHYLALRGATG